MVSATGALTDNVTFIKSHFEKNIDGAMQFI